MAVDSPNDNQLQVINHKEGRCIVMASAGSGKTYALIHRAKKLIEDGVDPAAVILTTFSKQAAEELTDRLRLLVRPQVLSRIKVGTMHSLCYRYLMRFRGRGYYTRVLMARDQYDLIRSLGKSFGEYKLNAKDVLDILSYCKNNIIHRDEWQDEFDSKGAKKVYWKIAAAYEAVKLNKKYIDFDDMLFHFYELLITDDSICAEVQSEVEHVMVDEAQDQNTLQMFLSEQLGKRTGHIMLIGDVQQAIYSFRGARPDIFHDWANDKITKIFFDQNYRSAPCIIKAANHLISNNAIKNEKKMSEESPIAGHIRVESALNRLDEASALVSILSEYRTKYNIPYEEFAFIYRTNAQAQAFEDVLSRRNIPYQIIGGTSFFERPEIADVLAYLTLSYNPMDDISLFRIANRPYRALGEKWEEQMHKNSQNSAYMALSSIYSSKAQGKQSRHLKSTLDDLRDFAPKHTVKETIKWVLNVSSPWSGGQTLGQFWSSEKNKEKVLHEGSSNLENVLTLAEMAADFTDCKKFVTYVQTLLTNFRTVQAEAHKVNLLTVHKAKGKEYTMVFVVGLNEDLLPHKNALLGVDGVGVAEGAKKLAGVEEERRICYVAITRAKQYLVLSSFSRWGIEGGATFSESRFLKEMKLEVAKPAFVPKVILRPQSALS